MTRDGRTRTPVAGRWSTWDGSTVLPGGAPTRRAHRSGRLPDPGERRPLTSWPLAALYLGFPLWWALGLSNLLFIAMAVPMAARLFRRGPVVVPPGFGVWLLFLVWVAVGVFVVDADAPGAVPDEIGLGTYLTSGYRLGIYLAVTTALLYVGNSRERELGSDTVVRLFAYMFVVTTAGGLLGVLAPTFEFRSAMEQVLPAGLAQNGFVNSLIHPHAADVQRVLGFEQARPVAPFTYANSWGANYSLFLPFFLVSWCRRDAGWRRLVAPVILLVSLVPVVYSLNRGLWAALAVGAVYAGIRFASQGRWRVLQALVAGVVLIAAILVVSPLGTLIQSRLENPHSNERRGGLFSLTVSSVLQGSPVLGFGTTRDVQGSFSSIAGGATDACRSCGVPDMGTQGVFWSVLFFQGFVGSVLFLWFFVAWFRRHRREPSAISIVSTTVVLMAGIQMFVYDFGGPPLFTVVIAMALTWREHRPEPAT